MIYAHINNQVLTIKPAEHSSAQAFMQLLEKGDLAITMHDYGHFEKVGDLGTSLPRNDESITTKPGDVILYQGSQITIYYDVNSWNFTKLGQIQNISASKLRKILGDGNVDVTFSLKQTLNND